MAKRRKRSPASGRFTLLLLLFATLLGLIGVRLVWLQVVRAPEYTAKASSQRMRDIEIPARRGTIYDREGEPLAKSVAASTVYAITQHDQGQGRCCGGARVGAGWRCRGLPREARA